MVHNQVKAYGCWFKPLAHTQKTKWNCWATKWQKTNKWSQKGHSHTINTFVKVFFKLEQYAYTDVVKERKYSQYLHRLHKRNDISLIYYKTIA